VLAALCTCAQAGSFVVTPVRVELSGSVRSAVLTVANSEDALLTLQLRTVEWTQAEGRDVFADSTELLATPAVFTLGPRGLQVFRVALRKPKSPQIEAAYRLFVEEVPAAGAGVPGVQVALRMSIPVFVAPALVSSPGMTWDARVSANRLVLSAFNEGNTSARLLGVNVSTRDAKAVESLPLTYVLARQRWSWALSDLFLQGRTPDTLLLQVTADEGNVDSAVTVNP